ncbi:hypothetical protein [Streptomyces sp. NPDC016845]|uniref:hypothetical protein n=1 Tax=Streptomyces sp. NPDC016845 TaxID=3364972 RepID=UPI0037AB2AFB
MKKIMTVMSLVVGAGAVTAGSAAADHEPPQDSHNGPVTALINTGHIDDPMEDVLEHTLNFGDGYRWG